MNWIQLFPDQTVTAAHRAAVDPLVCAGLYRQPDRRVADHAAAGPPVAGGGDGRADRRFPDLGHAGRRARRPAGLRDVLPAHRVPGAPGADLRGLAGRDELPRRCAGGHRGAGAVLPPAIDPAARLRRPAVGGGADWARAGADRQFRQRRAVGPPGAGRGGRARWCSRAPGRSCATPASSTRRRWRGCCCSSCSGCCRGARASGNGSACCPACSCSLRDRAQHRRAVPRAGPVPGLPVGRHPHHDGPGAEHPHGGVRHLADRPAPGRARRWFRPDGVGTPGYVHGAGQRAVLRHPRPVRGLHHRARDQPGVWRGARRLGRGHLGGDGPAGPGDPGRSRTRPRHADGRRAAGGRPGGAGFSCGAAAAPGRDLAAAAPGPGRPAAGCDLA